MTDSKYSEMLSRIYAAFGKSAPSETSPVYTFLFKRVSFIDDQFCDRIAAAIECYDKSPTNIGVAILNEYNKIAPTTTREKHQCNACYRNSGYIFFINPDYSAPNGYVARCPFCNNGNQSEIASQFEYGSKQVPTEKNPREFWEECFGEFIPNAKKQDDEDTPTDGNRKVAEHFKPISQAVDNLTDALEDFWAEA